MRTLVWPDAANFTELFKTHLTNMALNPSKTLGGD